MSSEDDAGTSRGNDGGHSRDRTFTRHDIDRVAVRLPPFWAEKPAVWFAQIEGNFKLSGIKDDDTKFYYVMSQLDQRYAAEVEDIICKPPDKDKYNKLKTELIKRLSLSREKEVKQLLIHEELGDRRPSQFLRHLQHLAGPNVPEDFIKSIWTSRLPLQLQTVVATGKSATLEELADLADRVHDIVPGVSSLTTTKAEPSCSALTLEKMAAEIAELSRQVKSLSATDARRSRPRYRQGNYQRRGQSKSQTRSKSSYRKFPICFFHFKHGDNARKCLKPCDYKGNANGGR